MGAVLRSTCLLPALKRKYPQSHITWVTMPSTKALLINNPLIDRLILYSSEEVATLQYLEFDLLYAVDKSLAAGALAETCKASKKFGFGLTPTGVIKPLNPEADYQYELGLNNDMKFFQNQKPETQQITESMSLTWQRDPYILELTPSEKEEVESRRKALIGNTQGIIGYNTGCSVLFPYKKLEVPDAINLVSAWRAKFPNHCVALLGGKEDQQRQNEIKSAFLDDDGVINTPTDQGLRSGVQWIAAADLVFSGCSLGMHIAIALKKPVIAWFGVSCAQEVDLYDNGIKILAKVACSPCWQKSCDKPLKCFRQVSVEEVMDATEKLLTKSN